MFLSTALQEISPTLYNALALTQQVETILNNSTLKQKNTISCWLQFLTLATHNVNSPFEPTLKKKMNRQNARCSPKPVVCDDFYRKAVRENYVVPTHKQTNKTIFLLHYLKSNGSG